MKKTIDMKNSTLLLRHAFILDVLCLLLCCALLYLGTNDKVSNGILITGALIALVALCASIWLFVKARKIERDEGRRIETQILDNAAREDAVDKAIEDGDIEDNVIADDQADYKNEDEQ